jgi:dipeptidyl aminopeptidase/acylaminoacyl peptidase
MPRRLLAVRLRPRPSAGSAITLLLLFAAQARALSPVASLPVPDIDAFMQIGAAGNPQLTPDGKTLLFSSAATGVNQIYRLDALDRWPYQLTVFTNGVDFYNLSPDGTTLVCGVSQGGDENSQLWTIDVATGRAAALTDLPKIQHGNAIFSPDSRTIYFRDNEANGKDFYIYRMDLRTGQKTLLVAMDGSNGPGDVSDDGKWLLVTHYTSNVANQVYLVDTAKGRRTELIPHTGDVLNEAAQFDASGKSVFVMSNGNPEGLLRRAVVSVATRTLSFLDTTGPWEVQSLGLSPDRRLLGWTVNEDGYVRLHLRDLVRAQDLPVPPVDGLVGSFTFPRGGSRVAFEFSSPTSTTDIWMWDWTAPSLEKMTHSTYAGIDPSTFVAPRLVHYTSFDGLEIPAFLYLPPGYHSGSPVPFVVHLHGGPESQFQPGFIRHFQYLLLSGYGILAPNVRGSSGYGKAYLDKDNYKNRLDSVKDLKAGADYLVHEGYSAPGMMAVKGASYGGYMTLAAVTEYPSTFSAAVDEVGIANFVTFLENTAPYRRALREAEYGPLTDRAFLESISPITKASQIQTPLLIVHGTNDPRVPIEEARQMVAAIKSRGGVVDTLVFADEGHGVSKRPNILVYYRKMAEFLAHTLKREPAAKAG